MYCILQDLLLNSNKEAQAMELVEDIITGK